MEDITSQYLDDDIKINNIKSEEEITKYYIDPSLSDKELINYIFTKGFTNQKSCLLANFNFYTSNNVIYNYLLVTVFANCDILDKDMHYYFSTGVFSIFNKEPPNRIYHLYPTEIFYKQILFFIKMISTKENEIGEWYSNCFTEMTKVLSNNIKIKLNDEVIEAALALGKTIRTPDEKRVCIFLCSQLLQIENTHNPEIIKRFVILHTESDLSVRREIGYQMRFIAKEKDVTFFIKNFLNIIYLYLEESDISIRTETIISSILNLDRVYDDDSFLKKLINVIIEFLQNEKMKIDKEYLVMATKIVKTLLLESQDKIKIAQIMDKAMKFIFKNFILQKEEPVLLNTAFYIIQEFHLYASYLKNFNEYNQLADLAELLILICFNPSLVNFKTIFPPSNETKKAKTTSLDSPSELNETSQPSHESVQICFLENIEKIEKYLPKDIINKFILTKYFSLLESSNGDIKTAFMESFCQIIQLNEKLKNYDFFSALKLNIPLILDCFRSEKIAINWRKQKEIFTALKNSKLLYEKEDLTFLENLYVYIKTILKEDHNFQIQCECAKLLVVVMKYSSNSKVEEILFYLESYPKSKSYYERRLFLPIFEESLNQFSIEFLKNTFFLNSFISMFINDKANVLTKLFKFIPQIITTVGNSDKKIKPSIQSRMEGLKKTSKIKDQELALALKKFEQWFETYTNNSNTKEVLNLIEKDKEKQKFDEKFFSDNQLMGLYNNENDNNNMKTQPNLNNLKNASRLNNERRNSITTNANKLLVVRKEKAGSNTLVEKNPLNLKSPEAKERNSKKNVTTGSFIFQSANYPSGKKKK